MKTNIKRIVAGAVIVFAPVLSVLVPSVAHAATITWTGAGTDNNWSTAANWQGGVAPTSGDLVDIDMSAGSWNSVNDNVAGLNLAGITFLNTNGGGNFSLLLSQDITISGPVVVDSMSATGVTIGSASTAHAITLGSDVTITSGQGDLSLGSSGNGDSLNLNGHALTLKDSGTAMIYGIYTAITGNGTLNLSASKSSYQLYTNGTYTGSTNLTAGEALADTTAVFGTSSISVANGSDIAFTTSGTATINNPISVAGITNGSPVTSLSFNTKTGSGPVTLSVPKITLNGETRFANDSFGGADALTVDLAGTTANGYCVEYIAPSSTAPLTDGPGNGFVNGPAGCIVNATIGSNPAPGTPNTGFAFMKANPVLTLSASVVAFLTIAGIAYKMRATGARR